MKKICAASLAVVLIFSLVLCGCQAEKSDSEKFIGKWDADVDFGKLITSVVAEQDADMAEYLDFKELKLAVTFTFEEDGTYTLETDEDAASSAMDGIKDTMKDGLRKYLNDLLAESGDDKTVDEYMAENGTTFEAFVDEIFGEDITGEGKWKAENGKPYTEADKDKALDDSQYDTYEFSSDGKTVTLLEGFGEDAELAELLYPLVLVKQD